MMCVWNTAYCETYKYTDDQGVVNTVDRASEIPEKYRNQMSLKEWKKAISQELAKEAQPGGAQGQRHNQKRVEAYVTSWCPYCNKLLLLLRSNGIEFTKYDIEHDTYGASRYKALGGGGVPVTIIGNRVIRGYKPQEILSASRN